MYCNMKFILQYDIYSPLPLIKTAQRNLQHCTKLYNKVHNVLHDIIDGKIEFLLCFGFVRQTKNKIYFLN